MPFYAVARGKETGVFTSWPECQEQTRGFRGAVFKKFDTEDEAKKFVQEKASKIVDKRKTENKTPEKTNTDEQTVEPKCSKCAQLSEENLCLRRQMEKLMVALEKVSKCSFFSKGTKRPREDDSHQSPTKKQKTESRNDEGFLVNSEGFVIVYTDGSCEFNGRHGAKAGVGVFFGPKHSKNVSEAVQGRPTNNTAEIQAATRACAQAKSAGLDKLIIRTDSEFMINCMTSWLPSWKERDWKKKDGTEVKNKEDLQKLDAQTEGLLIKWEHVKAHAGEEGNESADKLAKNGAKDYKAPTE